MQRVFARLTSTLSRGRAALETIAPPTLTGFVRKPHSQLQWGLAAISKKPPTLRALFSLLQHLNSTNKFHSTALMARFLEKNREAWHWHWLMKHLILCPNPLTNHCEALSKMISQRLFELSRFEEDRFRFALQISNEWSTRLHERIRLEACDQTKNRIQRLRLNSLRNGAYGSTFLKLDYDPLTNPPLTLNSGDVVLLSRFFSIDSDEPPSILLGFVSVSSYTKPGSFEVTTCNHLDTRVWTPSCLVEARILTGLNYIPYLTMLDALKKLDKLVEPKSIFIPEVHVQQNPSSSSSSACVDEIKCSNNLTHPVSTLNIPQKSALSMALSNSVSISQGPPGTGKTHTIVAILSQLLHTFPHESILVTAPTHHAVDTLMAKFLAIHARNPEFRAHKRVLVRVGSHSNVHPDHHSYLPYKINGISTTSFEIDKSSFFAKIVFATALGSGSTGIISSKNFDTVLVDEAAQIVHTAGYVPLVKAARRIVLVGDEKQLGPVAGMGCSFKEHHSLESPASVEENLKVIQLPAYTTSLMEAYLNAGNPCVPVVMLDEQYRMPAKLMEYSSRVWYDGKVKSHSCTVRKPLLSPPFLGSKFIHFLHVDGEESVTGRLNGSVSNIAEAVAVKKHVEQISAEVGGGVNIGVVSGYNAQVRLIRDILNEVGITDVAVGSVDGFQGQERDVIIFSAVKSNGHLGFLKDYRRMNVILTRARKGLIIVGHAETLKKDPVWRDLLDSI